MRWIYNLIFLPLGALFIRFASLVDSKSRRWLAGRRNLFPTLEANIAKLRPGAKRIWFHSSSMGEFEQAKPMIAELKKRRPDVEVIVSFFSPSGYDHSQRYKHASVVTYIPLDTAANAERFVRDLSPAAAVLVRYDVWPNHLRALKTAGVPAFIANATLSKSTPRSWPLLYGFHRDVYNSLDYILTVSESDKEAFESFRLSHPVIEVIGDTRFDQVLQRHAEAQTRNLIPDSFLSDKQFLVIGSSWEEDLNVLVSAIGRLLSENSRLGVIVVPHEPNEETLERIEQQFAPHARTLRFSSINDHHNERCVIVDSIGILTTLYKYARVAYVGGSFRQGVHNVLEPAVFGVPVVVGPRHENSQEAKQLIALGGAFTIADEDSAYERLRILFSDETLRAKAGHVACEYVHKNAGATEKFLTYLEKVI